MKKVITSFAIIFCLACALPLPHAATAKSWSSFPNIALDKEWTITFNRAIDPTTVRDNAYIMQGTTKLETLTFVRDNVLYVKAAQDLQHSTNYTLVITAQIRDTTGKQMRATQKVPFTTIAAPSYKTFESEYDMTWHMPNADYTQFHLTGLQDGIKTGGYETRDGYTLFNVKIKATTLGSVQKLYGQPVKSIKKGNTNYNQHYLDSKGNITHGTYLIDNYYVTFFYDIHKNNIVRSIKWVSAATEASKPTFFRTEISTNYRISLEETMVHLINQARVAEGLNALIYTPTYNHIGRKHSTDMVQYNYFSHTDRNGHNALQRMKDGNLVFSWYGENLAYGQYSAIYAHEALMNSIGHRENILRPNFTHVLVGVAFNSTGSPYFTINFYKP